MGNNLLKVNDIALAEALSVAKNLLANNCEVDFTSSTEEDLNNIKAAYLTIKTANNVIKNNMAILENVVKKIKNHEEVVNQMTLFEGFKNSKSSAIFTSEVVEKVKINSNLYKKDKGLTIEHLDNGKVLVDFGQCDPSVLKEVSVAVNPQAFVNKVELSPYVTKTSYEQMKIDFDNL